jgi:hypothetical protein
MIYIIVALYRVTYYRAVASYWSLINSHANDESQTFIKVITVTTCPLPAKRRAPVRLY